MEDWIKFVICLFVYLAILLADVVLFIMGLIGLPVFLAIMFASMVLLFLPILLFKDTDAVMSYDRIEVKGPFLTESIPYDRIRAIEFRESFKVGMKMYGYRGIKRCSGDFGSEEFGCIRFSGDISIPAFILISFSNKILVFNVKDAEYTRSLFDSLRTHVKDDGTPLSEGIDYESNEKRRKRIKWWAIGVVAAVSAIVIIVVAILIMGSHINITLTDDGINIDASMENEFILYTDIKDIEIRDSFDTGNKVMGYDVPGMKSGEFRNNEFGNYRLAIHSDIGKYIIIEKMDGKHTVFNCGSVDDTVSMYNEILVRKGIISSVMSVPLSGSDVPCYL